MIVLNASSRCCGCFFVTLVIRLSYQILEFGQYHVWVEEVLVN